MGECGEIMCEINPIYTSKCWYKDGLFIDSDGTKSWRNIDGKLHREDGPAVECVDGAKLWYINGKSHREDGPAIELANGNKYWYRHGEYHREDGPAVERANGEVQYWVDGVRLTKLEVFVKFGVING